MLVDRSRWKRDRRTQEHTGRREVYSQYISALSVTTHQLNDLWRHGPPTPEERKRVAGEVLTASGAYQLRWQMRITAPQVLEEPTERAFECLRNLRDRFDDPEMSKDLWDDAVAAITAAIDVLEHAMRDDLSEMERPVPPRRFRGRRQARRLRDRRQGAVGY